MDRGACWPPLLALAFCISAGPRALAKPSPQAPFPRFVRGVALGHYTEIPTAVLDKKLREIRNLGANQVSLVVSWSTPDVRASSLAPRKGHTTSDAALSRMIDRVHAHGLGAFLFPIISIERRKPLEWRGVIKPGDWKAWWRAYRRFILHYADLAARKRVELFCVGSELVSTEKQRDRWVGLIDEIRQRFGGKLVYSANWDHYRPVSFWDRVDLVGLTSYYRVAQGKEAAEGEMRAAWVKVRDKLVVWAKKGNRRLLFTEVGYPSLDGGAVHPWDYTQGTKADLEEQRRAYSAFAHAWKEVPQLAGVFFWDWYGDGGPGDRRYTPRGKPAQEVIRRFFKARAPR